jgi:hypothetical protein
MLDVLGVAIGWISHSQPMTTAMQKREGKNHSSRKRDFVIVLPLSKFYFMKLAQSRLVELPEM